MYTVYCHTNKSNGKRYIGITSRSVSQRWGYEGDGYYGQAFYNAIKKYGWDGFEHTILYTDLDECQAKEIEAALIAQYETTDAKKGYNVTKGGESANGLVHTPETKKRISTALKGRPSPNKGNHYKYDKDETFHWTGKKHSEETKQKMRESYKYHITDKTRRKMSENRKGKCTGTDCPRAHAVKCIDTGEVFATIKDAVAKTGVSSSHISQVCTGARKRAGGMRWEYAV